MGMPELEIHSMIGAEGFARLVADFSTSPSRRPSRTNLPGE
jgi:hypothetical protein